jgi:hypothetical protein
VSEDSFYGIIQGLSEDQIVETMEASALRRYEYSLEKVSPFKKIDNIIDIDKKDMLDVSNVRKMKKKDDESINIYGLDALGYIGGGEEAVILIVIILAVIGIFLIWAFVLIPLLIIILSLITAGQIWNMFRIYYIEIFPKENLDYNRLVNDIHIKGGALSRNWRKMLNSFDIELRDYKIRKNYRWIMRGIRITSYSLFIFILLLVNEFIYQFLNYNNELLTWLAFLSIIFIGFTITQIYSIKQVKLIKAIGPY